jgi:PRC-barrel domain protein
MAELPSERQFGDYGDWPGRQVLDPGGDRLGTVREIYLDRETHQPEWVLVAIDGGDDRFVPLADAAIEEQTIRVAHARETVTAAPGIGSAPRIDPEEERRLYEHYGVPYSDEESSTVLPEPGPATTPGLTQTEPPAAEPVAAVEAPAEPPTAAEPPAEEAASAAEPPAVAADAPAAVDAAPAEAPVEPPTPPPVAPHGDATPAEPPRHDAPPVEPPTPAPVAPEPVPAAAHEPAPPPTSAPVREPAPPPLPPPPAEPPRAKPKAPFIAAAAAALALLALVRRLRR